MLYPVKCLKRRERLGMGLSIILQVGSIPVLVYMTGYELLKMMDEQGKENVAQYIIRNTFSLTKLIYVEETCLKNENYFGYK